MLEPGSAGSHKLLMKKIILAALLATIGASANAHDINSEFLQWCGKTTIGEFAADNAANGGAGAPAGTVYFPPVAGLTFSRKPVQAVLIKGGDASAPDLYGITIQGSAQSAAALLAHAGHKAKIKPSTYQPGTVNVYCAATQAVGSD